MDMKKRFWTEIEAAEAIGVPYWRIKPAERGHNEYRQLSDVPSGRPDRPDPVSPARRRPRR